MDKIQELVFGYKKSIVIMAVVKSGIFYYLMQDYVDIQFLSANTGVKEYYLTPLLLFLEYMGIVEEKKDAWRVKEEFKVPIQKLEAFITYEAYILEKWMTPSMVESAIKMSIGERAYDKVGWDQKGRENYRNMMYGDNVKMLSYLVRRELDSDSYILEYGRNDVSILEEIARQKHGIKGIYLNLGNDYIGKEAVDMVLMYNVIHYLPKSEIKKILQGLNGNLRSTTKIEIIDWFYEKDSEFLNGIILDWITHGGIYHFTEKNLVEYMEELGYVCCKSIKIKALEMKKVTFVIGGQKNDSFGDCRMRVDCE